MKELINTIVQQTGISQENAQKAVQVMLGFLKTKLPTPVAAQLDSFLSANPVVVGAKA
jgi:nucleoid DNA-binding protein